MKFNSTLSKKQVNKLNIAEDRNEPIVGPVRPVLQPIATSSTNSTNCNHGYC